MVRNSEKSSKISLKLESEESEANRRPSLLANVMMGCFGGSASKNDAEEDKRRKEANKRIEKQIQKDKQIYRATHRLLLLGKCPHSLTIASRTAYPSVLFCQLSHFSITCFSFDLILEKCLV